MSRLWLLLPVSLLALASCDRSSPSPASKADQPTTVVETPPIKPELLEQPPPPAEPPKGDWLAFESDEGRYAVEFPRAPKRTSMPVPTAVGEVEAISHEVEMDDAYYAVAIIDYPADFVAEADPQQMLDGARDGAVANIGGELISERQLTLAGAPSRRLQIRATVEGHQIQLDAIHCVIGERLFQAVVTYAPGTSVDSERFLNSFAPRAAAPDAAPTPDPE